MTLSCKRTLGKEKGNMQVWCPEQVFRSFELPPMILILSVTYKVTLGIPARFLLDPSTVRI